MKILAVTRKYLIELGREPLILGLTILTPLVFLLIYALAYNAPALVTHPLLVFDPQALGQELVQVLQAERYPDGRPVFQVSHTQDLNAAELALKNQEATLLVRVAGNPAQPVITLRGDALNLRFIQGSARLQTIVQRYQDERAGRAPVVQFIEQPVQAGRSALRPLTDFEAYAPGVMIFAILMLIPQTAMLLAREVRWKTIQRLSLSRLSVAELLAGVCLAQMVVAMLQVVLLFTSGYLLGLRSGSLLLSLVIGLVLSFSAIGLGLITACFVSNDSQAVNVGSVVTMLQVFLSGSFFAIPSPALFHLAGHEIGLFDIFPATHGMLALQPVVLYGAGWEEIRFRVLAALLLSILYFFAGIWIFQHLQFKKG